MKKIFATIITIGDELLIGQVIDTNSAWIARELNKTGIIVKQRISVGDVWNDIWTALDEAGSQSDIVLITGGLGPTADDITKPLLNTYFQGNFIVDEWTLAHVKGIFERSGRPMVPRNLKQAEVPDTCKVVKNYRGTAPGMWFEKEGKVFVSMPGVPHEMQGMMTDSVLPGLAAAFALPTIVHRTLMTAGIGESSLADLIQEWEEALPDYVKLAYLPNYGMVRLRLTAVGDQKEALLAEVDALFAQLQILVGEYLVTNEDEPMEEVLLKLLKFSGKTMSTAESCTGGYIAHLLTVIPGASASFWGSVVSYDNSVKENVLQVSTADLQLHGAVSEAVARQMVKGVLQQTGTDYAVAVSGIMGPDGGSAEKPVGTVWIAAGDHQKIVAQKFHFRFDRRRNIELTATNALNFLRRFILEQENIVL